MQKKINPTRKVKNQIKIEKEATKLEQFLDAIKQGNISTNVCGDISWSVSFDNVDMKKLKNRLEHRGILSPMVLAERALSDVEVESEATSLQLTREQTSALHSAAIATLNPEERAYMEREIEQPTGKGVLPQNHPAIAPIVNALAKEKREASKTQILRWKELEGPWIFLPRGPRRAIDHRPKLGAARNQGGRNTCTSFAATAVVEALEFLRDRRPGPRDLSEEFLWWYSTNGSLLSGGGYDGRAALYHYEKNGVPDERLFPYSNLNIGTNCPHIPVPDDAIDRARDFRQPPMQPLRTGDVAAVKLALESGRCVLVISSTTDWNSLTGIVSFPDRLDSRGVGGDHCTAIIGYIDRDDLPAHFEGGYFIVRNSWGGANSPTHIMGPEYGGHLLMPYGWYRRYSGSPATLGSDADPTGRPASREWRAEYFTNRSLRGIPSVVESVPNVDFDWGTGGPFRITVSLPASRAIHTRPPSDEFSARFTQLRRLRPGWYRFTLRGDDGLRLWVDDRLIINSWKNQARTFYTVEHYVSGGDHVLRVEYYEASGLANIRLQVEAIEFRYELFTNTDVAGRPSAVFNDSLTDVEWRHAPPVSTVSVNGPFSLRVTGSKQFRAGTYSFHAQHTGGCRMWIDDRLVLDDWSGTNGNGAPVSVTGGVHSIRVEFVHRTPIPPADAKSYYRAALAFDWAEYAWFGRIYKDPGRKVIQEAGWPNPDSAYEAFRVQALTGNPILTYDYPVPRPADASYEASDSSEWSLTFGKPIAFGEGIPGGEGIDDNMVYYSVILTRRLYIPVDGLYQVSLKSDESFRVCVDGIKVLERRFGGGDAFATDLVLHAGVHDISVEYADTAGGSRLEFRLKPAKWSVSYYLGTNLETRHSDKQIMGIDRVVRECPGTLAATSWSARATRIFWLPVGRFRITVRAADGIRLKVNGDAIMNAWKDQVATTYTAFLEHPGGNVFIEVEYYRASSNAELFLELTPDGFIGEYYRGVELEKTDSGASWLRNPPIAYRFEPVVDFDWGSTGRLARVGSDRFSARWWGSLELPVGRWKFKLTSDDGVRLFLDERLLIDRWLDQPPTTYEAVVDLAGTRRDLRVEYYERSGGAICRLELERLL